MKYLIKIILPIFISLSYGQLIKIGMPANKVESLVKFSTESKNGYDSYGNSKGNNVVYDVKYYDGQISEVIQCYHQQYIYNWQTTANFCEYYIMKYGALSYVLYQYENISVAKLKEYYSRSSKYKIIDEYYFDNDYKNYSKIYLENNGLASVEWRNTELSSLPNNVKTQVAPILEATKKAEMEAEKQRALELEVKRLKEEEALERQTKIQSKTYNLKELNESLYNDICSKLRNGLFNSIKGSSDYSTKPCLGRSLKDLQFDDINKFRTTNKYAIHVEETYYNNSSGKGGYSYNRNVKLLSGTDSACKIADCLYGYANAQIEGYPVSVEYTCPTLSVDYAIGTAVVKTKIKNNKIDEVKFKEDIPDIDIQEKIIEQLKSKDAQDKTIQDYAGNIAKGNCYLQYFYGNVDGKEFLITKLTIKVI